MLATSAKVRERAFYSCFNTGILFHKNLLVSKLQPQYDKELFVRFLILAFIFFSGKIYYFSCSLIESIFFLYFSENFGLFRSVFRIRIHFLRIRIQRIQMEANTDLDPDPDPIRIQGSTKNLKKITAEKKIKFFFDQKLQFTYP